MRVVLLFFGMMLLMAELYAQVQIRGVVIDKSSQQPLEYAYIKLSPGSNTTVSGKDGGFTISFKDAGLLDTNSFLIVSYIGYATKKLNLSQHKEAITVELQKGIIDLTEVVIRPQSNQVSFNTIGKIDLNLQPVRSAQDILRTVPGLFIGQHQGGGKAEQIFLRGFDIDHGTDINVTVDGMPVNMVSHAHGQGYADLHFLIPELTAKVDYGKGPYYAAQGNMGTAGYVSLNTIKSLDNSTIKLEAGQFNTVRVLAMVDLLNARLKEKGTNAYIASELLYSDGPFKSPQRFNRFNIFGKFNTKINSSNRLDVSASSFSSDWDASGQVPERAVKNGSIDRFGYIDSIEGGYTSRTNLNIRLSSALKNNIDWLNQFYYSNYRFNLHSNFTFFLNNPTNGDQIRQRENRNIYGYLSTLNQKYALRKIEWNSTYGAGIRFDQINNSELSNTVNRNTVLLYHQLGNINELNWFVFTNHRFKREKWLLDAGTRFDFFTFSYNNRLSNNKIPAKFKHIISPKLNIQYTFNDRTQAYINIGKGFHSNDTRVILGSSGRQILPAAYGADIGINLKPLPGLFLNSSLWYLFLEQEFVYVGDEGIVEASGKSKRIGIDLSARHQINKWLFADINVNLARPRNIEAEKGEDFIPLAPTLTSTGGLSWRTKNGVNGSLRFRHLKDRSANETNTLIAKGYTIADLSLNYTRSKYEIGIAIENLFNAKWNETQFETESRLKHELEPMSEIHFTPGVPFFARIKFAVFF